MKTTKEKKKKGKNLSSPEAVLNGDIDQESGSGFVYVVPDDAAKRLCLAIAEWFSVCVASPFSLSVSLCVGACDVFRGRRSYFVSSQYTFLVNTQ